LLSFKVTIGLPQVMQFEYNIKPPQPGSAIYGAPPFTLQATILGE